MTATIALPDYSSAAYLEAYSRINAMVIVGEGLADRHFRLLARAIPEDAETLQTLAAMEGRHARDFVGCGVHLGVKPDVPLARSLFAPLHAMFLKASRAGDRVACLVIQCLIVESFAVAAYRCYLPVADAYAKPITAEVLKDEALHLSYGEDWLRPRFQEVAEEVVACCRRAVPVALGMLNSWPVSRSRSWPLASAPPAAARCSPSWRSRPWPEGRLAPGSWWSQMAFRSATPVGAASAAGRSRSTPLRRSQTARPPEPGRRCQS